jgi:site-specific recombinase XerC
VHLVRSASSDLIHASHLAGDAIIAFTFIYCTLNWQHYRNIRLLSDKDRRKTKDAEKKDSTHDKSS